MSRAPGDQMHIVTHMLGLGTRHGRLRHDRPEMRLRARQRALFQSLKRPSHGSKALKERSGGSPESHLGALPGRRLRPPTQVRQLT